MSLSARLVGALLLLSWPFLAAPAVAQQPMNLVVFLTDDQRFDSLWAMPIVQNRLGSRGVTFTKAVVTTPICCPFRASFLSGGYLAQNTGVLHNQPPLGGFQLFYDRETLPVLLQRDAGYRTFLVGKYLNEYGPATMSDPNNPYIPPGWDRFLGWAGGSYFNGLIYSGSTGDQPGTGTPRPRGGSSYETDVYADHTIDFLDDFPGVRRFISFATFVPHYPSTPAPVDATLFPTFVYRGRAYGETDLSDKPYYVQALASPYWTQFNSLDTTSPPTRSSSTASIPIPPSRRGSRACTHASWG
jgi:arylsulfatase A-like enzyme